MTEYTFLLNYFNNGNSFTSEQKCSSDDYSQSISSLDLKLSSDEIVQKIRTIINFFTSPDQRELNMIVTEPSGNEVTPKSIIKSVLTDYIVSDIVMNESERIFIYILNSLSRSFFNAYKNKSGEDFRLIYKGGNVTKIYFDDMIDNYFDDDLKPEIYTKYGINFKNSDLDFTVENFNLNSRRTRDEQRNILIPIVWYILSIARIIILNNMRSLYDFCKINFINMNGEMKYLLLKVKQELQVFNEFDDVDFIGVCLDKYLYLPNQSLKNLSFRDQFEFIDIFNQENEEKIEKEGSVPKFFVNGDSRRMDSLILNDYNPSTELVDTEVYSLKHFNQNLFDNNIFNHQFENIVLRVLPNEDSQFFISNSLDIHGNNDVFSLSRLMINFVIVYSKDSRLGAVSVPSELYDVTFVSEILKEIFHLEPNLKFNNYSYRFVDTDGQIIEDNITIMSEFEIVNDLIDILFIENIFPWNDKKYKKRLIRLIFISRYIKVRYQLNPIRRLDIGQFFIGNIIEKYFPQIEEKLEQLPISTLEEQISKEENEEEFEKLKRIIIDTETDIDSYFARTNKRVNVNSSITRITI